MSKGIEGPTWAILSPSNLPDAGEWTTLLGSIVADFEHPLDYYIPDDIRRILPRNTQSTPTEDTNFKVALLRASGRGASARLGNILRASFKRDIRDEIHLISTNVQTYTLKQQLKVFALLKKKFRKEILDMIDRAPSRIPNTVFMVVGIKTCLDAKISSQNAKQEEIAIKSALPATSILTKGIGTPPVTDIDLGGAASSTKKGNADDSQVAKGARIFALQYRLIKRETVWLQSVRPKRTEFDLGDNFVPGENAMFGGEEDEGEEGDDSDIDDEDDDEEEDPIQLGDLQHTWSLKSTDDSGVIMAAL
ncbi:hypothetical protein GP486_001834 [Trichoglossum hirsutum]|uniref:Uncharacterized protein n=1 Tax=Trichoglossum hirsutum TaxID=265104 RepID=A0A9P8LG83_9PEZI|nr:hypothetical protein GP486_001834 [Trichoglossum hirsutum]